MTTPKTPPGYSKPMTDAYDPYADDPTVGLEESVESSTWEDDTAIAGDDGYGGDATLDSYDPLSGEDPEAGLNQLESGNVPEPPPPSQEEMLAQIEGMEELLQEFKKDLPKAMIKQIKAKLKELKKLVDNEKTFAYSLAYITADLDDIQIKILDAATGGLKDAYKDAKDKISDVEDKLEAATDLAPGVKEDLLKRIDDAEDQLKEDPSDETIAAVIAAVGQIEQELDAAIDEPYANNTEPTKVDGSEATYQNATDVDLTTNFGDEINSHMIYASGTVVIHPSSQKDKMVVEYNPNQQAWSVGVYKKGDMNSEAEWFTIYGGKDTNVIVDVLSEKQVEGFNNHSGHLEAFQIGMNGEASDVNVNLSPSLDALRKLSVHNKNDFLTVLYKYYPEFDSNGDGVLSVTEANQAVEDGIFPPKTPDATLFKFLVHLDQKLHNRLNTFHLGSGDKVYADVRDRVVELLQKLYSGTETTIEAEGYGEYACDNIIINGTLYDLIDQDAAGYVENTESLDGDLYKYLVLRE